MIGLTLRPGKVNTKSMGKNVENHRKLVKWKYFYYTHIFCPVDYSKQSLFYSHKHGPICKKNTVSCSWFLPETYFKLMQSFKRFLWFYVFLIFLSKNTHIRTITFSDNNFLYLKKEQNPVFPRITNFRQKNKGAENCPL